MQKVWQWIQDRKTNSIRKWRSTFGNINDASTSGEPNRENLLDVPGGHLQPIGGSDNALSRVRSEKIQRSMFGKISRRFSPKNKSMKDRYDESNALLTESVNGRIEHDNPNFFDSKQLFDSVNQFLYEIPTTTTNSEISTPEILPDDEKFLPLSYSPTENAIEEPPPPLSDDDKGGDDGSKNIVTTSSMHKKEFDSKRERKRTRFIIPHVSVSTFDDPEAAATVLYPASDQNDLNSNSFTEERQSVEEDEEYDLYDMDMPETSKSEQENEITDSLDDQAEPSTAFPKLNKSEKYENELVKTEIPRRSVTDIDRRRMSMQQRRLSNVQLVQSVSGRRNSTTLIPLTCAQIHLVRALWRQVYLTKGPTVIGQTIIHRLFFKCSKTKEQFKRCPLPRSFPNHDSFAKSHCKAVAELVDQVVENLDNLENMCSDLEKLGRVHAQVMGGQLSSKLWNNVAETFIDCTLEWGDRRCRSETVRKAWALIVAFMVERIKIGHVEQRKQLLATRTNAISLDRSNTSTTMRVTFV